MNLIDRIGYDAGATRLEDALAHAGEHGSHYLDFSADTGPNRVDNWPDDRLRAVRSVMDAHEIAVTVHTSSAVNVAEFAPHVSDGRPDDRYGVPGQYGDAALESGRSRIFRQAIP